MDTYVSTASHPSTSAPRIHCGDVHLLLVGLRDGCKTLHRSPVPETLDPSAQGPPDEDEDGSSSEKGGDVDFELDDAPGGPASVFPREAGSVAGPPTDRTRSVTGVSDSFLSWGRTETSGSPPSLPGFRPLRPQRSRVPLCLVLCGRESR